MIIIRDGHVTGAFRWIRGMQLMDTRMHVVLWLFVIQLIYLFYKHGIFFIKKQSGWIWDLSDGAIPEIRVRCNQKPFWRRCCCCCCCCSAAVLLLSAAAAAVLLLLLLLLFVARFKT
jgi:hypothetical protein